MSILSVNWIKGDGPARPYLVCLLLVFCSLVGKEVVVLVVTSVAVESDDS